MQILVILCVMAATCKSMIPDQGSIHKNGSSSGSEENQTEDPGNERFHSTIVSITLREGVTDNMTNTELKSIRESLDLSKTDFAREIGISPVMEGKYEKGSKEIPETVSQAAYALMNAAEEDTASVADEESVSVTGEEAAPEADEEAAAEPAAPTSEELLGEILAELRKQNK